MKNNFLQKILIITLLVSFVSCSTPEEASVESVEVIQFYEYNEIENETLDLINDYRVSQGLNVLEKINHISHLSLEHNGYMMETNIIGHANFGDRQINLHKTLGALQVGENVAFNYVKAEDAVNAWINSPGHKVAIIGDYTHFGISIRENNLGQKFYTNIFIKK